MNFSLYDHRNMTVYGRSTSHRSEGLYLPVKKPLNLSKLALESLNIGILLTLYLVLVHTTN